MKLLIAEDEPLCLKNLEELDWASVGIDTVLTAGDGKQAYQTALNEKPDIILSDIQMPKMNGLLLAEKLSVNLPESQFIILTAYNDFTYAQSAISSGVSSYILKPFMDEDVMNAVKNATEHIRDEQQKNSYNTQITKQLEVSKNFLMSYFFNSVSDKDFETSELYNIFGIDDFNSVCTAMIVSLDYAKEADSFKNNYRIFNHLMRIFSTHNATVLPFFNTTQLVYFFLSESGTPQQKALNSVLVCADDAETYLNFNYTDKYVIGIGNSLSGISNCRSSYNSALDAVKYSFYLGFNSVICITDLEQTKEFDDYQTFPKDEFFGYVKVGDFENACFLLQKLFNNFRKSQTPTNTVRRICHEILVHLALCLLQCGQNADLIFNKTNVWEVLQQYNSLTALEEFVINFVDVTVSAITHCYNQKNMNLVKEVKKYISTHLDTSLNEIADHFFHSPNYLSTIFSKEAGITIKNYMIAERIEHAKKLLANPNIKISTIAAKVGYKSTQHFSTVFSSQTGMSPTSYRNTLFGSTNTEK